jgi:hypothetical protein
MQQLQQTSGLSSSRGRSACVAQLGRSARRHAGESAAEFQNLLTCKSRQRRVPIACPPNTEHPWPRRRRQTPPLPRFRPLPPSQSEASPRTVEA